MPKTTPEKEEYSYCQLTAKRFLIMRRLTGSTQAWSVYAEAKHEPAAKRIVAMLAWGRTNA